MAVSLSYRRKGFPLVRFLTLAFVSLVFPFHHRLSDPNARPHSNRPTSSGFSSYGDSETLSNATASLSNPQSIPCSYSKSNPDSHPFIYTHIKGHSDASSNSNAPADSYTYRCSDLDACSHLDTDTRTNSDDYGGT